MRRASNVTVGAKAGVAVSVEAAAEEEADVVVAGATAADDRINRADRKADSRRAMCRRRPRRALSRSLRRERQSPSCCMATRVGV